MDASPLAQAALPADPRRPSRAVVALLRADDRVPESRRDDLLCLTAAAIAMYWQVFPRSDSMHVTLAMPLAGARRRRARARRRRTMGCVRSSPRLSRRRCAHRGRHGDARPPRRAFVRCTGRREFRLALCVEPSASDDLNDLRAAASYVRVDRAGGTAARLSGPRRPAVRGRARERDATRLLVPWRSGSRGRARDGRDVEA